MKKIKIDLSHVDKDTKKITDLMDAITESKYLLNSYGIEVRVFTSKGQIYP